MSVIMMTRTRRNERQSEINAMPDSITREEAQRNLDACYRVSFVGLKENVPTEPAEFEKWTINKENALIVKRFLKWKKGVLSVDELDALSTALKSLGVRVDVSTLDRDVVVDAIVDEVYRRYEAKQQEG